jgi:hypothetical protein
MPLLDPKIGRGLFASIVLNLVLDGLSLVERTQPGPLNSRDVDEHIFATAARRLNKPISLCRIEPVCTENLNPDIMVMKSAENRV